MEISDAKKVLEQTQGKMNKAVEFLENELAAKWRRLRKKVLS